MARPRGTSGQAKVLTQYEFKRVIKIAAAAPNKLHGLRNVAILYVSFYLALRVGEIAKLRVSDVLDKKGKIKEELRLYSTMTKTKRHRDLYLSNKALRSALKAYLDERTKNTFFFDEALFMSQKGGAFSANSMAQLMKRLFEEAGLENASSHSGRRTCLTQLSESGVSIKNLATIAGHASINTTSRYIEANPVKISRILAKMAL